MITIEEIKKQEELLQFKKFDNEVAYEIGNIIFEKAKERKLPVAISISRCSQILFYVSLTGATLNNELWLKRKVNTAYHFQCSSMILEIKQSERTQSMCERHGLPPEEYAPAGGAFPVILKGAGMVGVIGVSGLPSEDDHALIIESIEEHLKIR